MKLAHRPRIASTTIKLISKPILLPILSILLEEIQWIGAEDPKHRPYKHVRHLADQFELYYFLYLSAYEVYS